MQRTTLSGMILGFVLFCCGGVIVASEADELREKAKAMRKEAKVLAKQGNTEGVEGLTRESAERMVAAERMELKAKGNGKKEALSCIDKDVKESIERLIAKERELESLAIKEAKLRAAKGSEKALAEVREQISGTEREYKEIQAHLKEIQARDAERGDPEFRAEAQRLKAATQGIQHLRVAAKNFKKAELNGLAEQLVEAAEGIERQIQEAKQRLTEEMKQVHEHPAEQKSDDMPELRARLRAEGKDAVPAVKWEYKVIKFYDINAGGEMEGKLNTLGEEGWECVSTISESRGAWAVVILKRLSK